MILLLEMFPINDYFSAVFLFLTQYVLCFVQAREMEKRKEGKPGDARAALRRSVRENGSLSLLICLIIHPLCIYI